MRKAVWMSFDLGVKGDYEGLYSWLDAQEARECCDNVAFFFFEAKNDLPTKLKRSLKESVEVDARTRIYIIFLGKDVKMRGRFLFGKRKAPPWAGFGPSVTMDEDEYGD